MEDDARPQRPAFLQLQEVEAQIDLRRQFQSRPLKAVPVRCGYLPRRGSQRQLRVMALSGSPKRTTPICSLDRASNESQPKQWHAGSWSPAGTGRSFNNVPPATSVERTTRKVAGLSRRGWT